jgi:hypothetical protein
MKKIVLLLFLALNSYFANAQINEAGLFVGGSNYIGDIGSTYYVNPHDLAIGALFKWNISTRYSYRISATISQISGDDSKSDIASRVGRDFNFKNSIKELSAGMEFNFLEFNLHDFTRPATPYIYSGVSYFSYNNIFFDGNNAVNSGNHSTFAIPIAIGFKLKIAQHLVLGAEVGARYTFTDNLDGSNPVKSLKNDNSLKFGNVNNNDWYVFSGMTLTYTFNRMPCYNCFKAKDGKRKIKLFK